MSTYIVYQTLVESYKRLGRDTAPLGAKIDLAYALGRITDAEYTELVGSITPAAEEAESGGEAV